MVRIFADGFWWSMETFIAAYRYEPFSLGQSFPPGWVFSVLFDDGRVLSPVYGYEVPGLRPLAVLYVEGGDDNVSWGRCDCGAVGPLREGECAACARVADEDDDDCECECNECKPHYVNRPLTPVQKVAPDMRLLLQRWSNLDLTDAALASDLRTETAVLLARMPG